jgi:hypothetical protein
MESPQGRGDVGQNPGKRCRLGLARNRVCSEAPFIDLSRQETVFKGTVSKGLLDPVQPYHRHLALELDASSGLTALYTSRHHKAFMKTVRGDL